MGVIKLKPNLCTAYIRLCKNFRRREKQAEITVFIKHEYHHFKI